MQPSDVYELLVAEIADEDKRKVFDLLLNAGGSHVTREELSVEVYGEFTPINDRKVRKVIQWLRELDYPIVSSSGAAGYTMQSSPKEMESYIAQMRSRIEVLQSNIDHAYRSQRVAELVRTWRESNPQPIQLSFLVSRTEEVSA